MPNASRLIDETLGLLQSFTQDIEQTTTLGADIGASDLSFNVLSATGGLSGLSPGVIEMGTELIYCDSVDATGHATIPAWGRGYDNTTAAAHAAGTRVTSQPSFPRFWVLEAINETIRRVFPRTFAVSVSTFTATFPVITYDLPDTAQWVLDARWQPPTGTGYWQAIKRWRMGTGGTTVVGDPGISVDVADYVIPGSPIEFTVASMPSQLVNDTDDFEATTGFATSMRDVIVTGAAAQLTTSQELSRLQMFTIEQQDRARLVAPSAALTSSRFLEQKFLARLQEETMALRRRYPVRLTGGWV
jgi:hypothetical protein